MANQLFARKSLRGLLAEAEGDNRLKRVLGPINLTALGVGAIIGAGIFASTGAAAKEVAGPALMLSYVVAGLTCIFAALCYAEFASMAPVAGSAYTYAYCTMGELFAWIIGWDLVLEYAVGSATVANAWSGYFQSVLAKVGIVLPMALSAAPLTYDEGVFRQNVFAEYLEGDKVVRATHKLVDEKDAAGNPTGKRALHWIAGGKDLGRVGDPEVEMKFHAYQPAIVNLAAVVIVLLVTLVLVKGISESAGFNAFMVFVKVGVVLFVIIAGAFFVQSVNWFGSTDPLHPERRGFAPFGYGGFSFFGIPELTFGQKNEAGKPLGMLAGAAIIFFAYIGFDSVSTHAEEAKNPSRDVPIGIIASLVICTILYIAVVAVLTGMVPFWQIEKDAGISSAFKALSNTMPEGSLTRTLLSGSEAIIAIAGVAGITSVLLVMMLSGPRVFLAMARDGLVPRAFFAEVHPTFQTPWKSTIGIGVFVMILAGVLPIDALLELTNIGTLFAFVVVCAAVLIMRQTDPDAHRPFRCPLVPIVPILGILTCLMLMMSLPVGNWLRLLGWLALGLLIYFSYGMHHSTLGKELREGKAGA
jgi:APA family basic amino acid/polyamine antiporter